MTRAEKLFCIRAQVQKATAEVEHGDTYASCLALADALGAVLSFLEEELSAPIISPAPQAIHLKGERVKEEGLEAERLKEADRLGEQIKSKVGKR